MKRFTRLWPSLRASRWVGKRRARRRSAGPRQIRSRGAARRTAQATAGGKSNAACRHTLSSGRATVMTSTPHTSLESPIVEIGERPRVPSAPSSPSQTSPCSPEPTSTEPRARATARRARTPTHLRPDRDPPVTASAARERGRRSGERFAALSSGATQNFAAAQSYGDALARGRASARMEDEYANAVANDPDSLKNLGF